MAQQTTSYTIPLRRTFQQAAPMKRTPKAVRAVKSYLTKHCKTEEVRLGAQLNKLLWQNGIANPPAKVTVDVKIDDGVAKAELTGHTYKEAKKIVKKEEPGTLKEKIASKIGADQPKAQAAEEEQPAKEEKKEEAAEQKKPSEEQDKKQA